jgi:hypothetical protein
MARATGGEVGGLPVAEAVPEGVNHWLTPWSNFWTERFLALLPIQLQVGGLTDALPAIQ